MPGDADVQSRALGGRQAVLFRALRGWSGRDLGADVAAGLTLAAIAIPEQMATARLAGLSPDAGFFAFIAGSVAFAAFGANRYLSVGADSTIAPIFAGGLSLVAASGSPHYVELAAMLALMVGAIVLVSGLLRLGWIADLLSVPVTAGFLAGISVHIVISQLPDLLGLPQASGSVFDRVAAVASAAAQISAPSLGLGLAVFLVVLAAERISARIPAALIGIVLATLAVIAFNLKSRGVAVLGALPEPSLAVGLPKVAFEDLRTLAPLALLISWVVIVQTAATTRSFPGRAGPPDVDRDFVGVGTGSIAAGLLGAFAVNASPPRTAIVSETGGRSQLSGLLAAAIVLLIALFGATLLANVPQAALAGILFFVAFRILRWQTFIGTFRRAPIEFALIVITAVAIIALPIEVGVATGIGLSLLHGVWSTTQAKLVELERVPGTSIWWPPGSAPGGERVDGVLVAAFQAPLSFVNAERFRQELQAMAAARRSTLRLVVLEASNIVDIDYTAAGALTDVIAYFRGSGVGFSIARLESVRAQAALVRFGIAEQLGKDGIFHSVENAVAAWSRGAANPSDAVPTA
ncbi:SulP family inorganic anion transporter [Mesorhizobium sp. BAC0120]|uniref:SulP family inorganic anion transporter n=1 Tax=Mesorhizobium sp. BAC0120 TaxID=3090670 RepID=UPI00298C4F09|nr:SulP family inorganic anion transporter [Mesorhizobium sp. BAC0120]MDW6022016.1 SulP family inorganic anion transporter [Mesorhizobium sp. BAC0120]